MQIAEKQSIVLKKTTLADIKQMIIWQTTEVEWQDWDAPWEKDDIFDELKYTERIKKIIELVQKGYKIPYRFEVWLEEPENRHIGWVSAYYIDENYIYNVAGTHLAIGIGIPKKSDRNKGYGKEALLQYIDLLKKRGHLTFHIQTWSGNIPMIKTAEKLGFYEINCYKDKRIVKNSTYDALTFYKEFSGLM